MGTIRRPVEPVHQDFLEYAEDLEMDSLPAERALTVLMQHDVPMLLKEIVRLRPELS
jgi:hypothetical protein